MCEEKPVYNSHLKSIDLLVLLGIWAAYLSQSHESQIILEHLNPSSHPCIRGASVPGSGFGSNCYLDAHLDPW